MAARPGPFVKCGGCVSFVPIQSPPHGGPWIGRPTGGSADYFLKKIGKKRQKSFQNFTTPSPPHGGPWMGHPTGGSAGYLLKKISKEMTKKFSKFYQKMALFLGQFESWSRPEGGPSRAFHKMWRLCFLCARRAAHPEPISQRALDGPPDGLKKFGKKI